MQMFADTAGAVMTPARPHVNAAVATREVGERWRPDNHVTGNGGTGRRSPAPVMNFLRIRELAWQGSAPGAKVCVQNKVLTFMLGLQALTAWLSRIACGGELLELFDWLECVSILTSMTITRKIPGRKIVPGAVNSVFIVRIFCGDTNGAGR